MPKEEAEEPQPINWKAVIFGLVADIAGSMVMTVIVVFFVITQARPQENLVQKLMKPDKSVLAISLVGGQGP